MAAKSFVLPITLTSLPGAGFSGAYQLINTAGLPFPCFMIRLINNTNSDVLVSYDGSTDHDYVFAGTTLQLPFQENAEPNNFAALLKVGTKIWVNGTALSTGNIYLSGWYQPTQ